MKRMKVWNRRTGAGMAAASLAMAMILGCAQVTAAPEDEAQTEQAGTEQTGPVQGAAGEGFDMSTDYPGILTKAGETTSFSLDFASLDGAGHDVALSVTSMPDAWSGYFKSSSAQITKVHVGGAADAGDGLASFSLTVPAEAEEGTYTVELAADDGEGNTDVLALDVTVSQEEAGESNFTSEYPEQQGASGTTFSFDTTLVNNRGTNQSYSLSAEAPAEGWQVTFTPSGESTNVASIDVDADASKGLTVTVTPPANVEKGDYTIPVTAVSSNDTLKLELAVEITGTYGVTLSTSDQRLSFDAEANKQSTVTLTITNTGNVDLTNLNLTSAAPTDWDVSFSESAIDTLEAGATREVTAYVTPSEDALTGDYETDITISNSEVSSKAQFRVSVKTPTTWGIVAVAIIVVLVLGLGFIFKKYGRR